MPSSSACAAAHAARGARGRRASPCGERSPGFGGSSITKTGWPGRSCRGGGSFPGDSTARSPRPPRRSSAGRPARPPTRRRRSRARTGRGSRRDGRGRRGRPPSSTPANRPRPRRATSSRKTRSTGSSAQKARICSRVGSTRFATRAILADRVAAVPIHLRADPGDYAEAVLLPGDPLRAKYIAETSWRTRAASTASAACSATRAPGGQADLGACDGDGLPAARRSSFEELVQLGVKKLLRVGTCGGLQPGHALGDLIVAISAVPADSTAMHLVANSRTADRGWELVHGAVHVAKEWSSRSTSARSSPATSSTTRTRPVRALVEAGRARGRDGGGGAVHASARSGVQAGCLLTVSDIVVEGEFKRISDDELRAAVDQMTRVALTTATSPISGETVFSSTRPRRTAPPGGAGPSSRTAPPPSVRRATRSSPSGPDSWRARARGRRGRRGAARRRRRRRHGQRGRRTASPATTASSWQ